jgi:serine/arginine repetitive matrix protein 2
MPVENLAASQPPSAKKKTPIVEPVPEPEEAPTPLPSSRAAVAEAIEAIRHQTSKESAILPPSFSRTTTQDTVQEPESPPDSHGVSPLFEAIDEIESLHPTRTRTSSTSHKRRRSTATRRSDEYAIEDENPDVVPRTQPVRRTSTYAPSIRSNKTTDTERTERTEKSSRTEKSDRSDKTDREKTRYLYESRSAAIKALYPNSPMAGQSTNGSSKASIRSEKMEKKKDRSSKESTKDSSSRDSRESKRESRELTREKSIPDNGTWDTNSTMTSEDFAPTHVSTNVPYAADTRKSMEAKRESRELRRKESVSVAGTWDTSSEITHRGPATTVSTNVPYSAAYDPRRDSKELKRESRELKRRPSVSDAGTWDTATEFTYRAPPTTISTNVPYSTEFPYELRRERSIPDNGTWDTNSVFTEFAHRRPPTTVSTNLPYPTEYPPELSHLGQGLRRERSIPDNGTWDTSSVFTTLTRRAPPTTVSTNIPYPTGLPRELRRSNSVSSTGTWDTNSEFTQFAHRAPPTTVSTNVPYPSGLPRQLRRSHSIASSTGTWDTSSDFTQRAAPTTISTNAPYMSELPRQLRRDSISDDGTWDTGSDFTHANDGPVNTASKAERLRSLKKKRSMQSNGTWDTNSVITTNDDMKTSVSTNVTYAAERRR